MSSSRPFPGGVVREGLPILSETDRMLPGSRGPLGSYVTWPSVRGARVACACMVLGEYPSAFGVKLSGTDPLSTCVPLVCPVLSVSVLDPYVGYWPWFYPPGTKGVLGSRARGDCVGT